MQPSLALRRAAGPRRITAALVCLVAAAAVTVATAGSTANRHHARAHAVLSVAAADTLNTAPRIDQPAVAGSTPTASALVLARVIADTSANATSYTAHSPSARGPPGQALA